MRTGATVVRNTVYLSLSTTTALCINLGFNIFLARALGVERFGGFSFAISFITMFSMLVDFSLDSIIVRDVARSPETAGRYFGNALVLKTLMFSITLTLVVAIASLMGYPFQIRLLLYILALGLLFDSVKHTCFSVFTAAQIMQYPAILFALERVIFVFLGLVTVILNGSVVMLGICHVVAQAIIQLASVILLRRKLGIKPGHVEYIFCKNLMQKAFSFCAISVIAAAYVDIDKLLLFSMQDGTAVGLYAAANKLVTIPTRFSSAFHKAVYPVLAKHAAFPDRKLLAETYHRSMRYLMLGVIPLAIVVTVLAEQIIRVVYGEDYLSGVIALRILVWAYALEFFNPFFSRILFAVERQRSVLATVVGATSLNIILNIILIPRYSFLGAAIATLSSSILIFSLLFSFVFRLLPQAALINVTLKLLLAGLSMGVVYVLPGNIPLIPQVFLSIVAYCCCIAITKTVSLEEILELYADLSAGLRMGRRETV